MNRYQNWNDIFYKHLGLNEDAVPNLKINIEWH